MNDFNRSIDPAQAFLALQQFSSNEITRYYSEIAMRDAYIKKLEDTIKELEEKINGQ